MDGVRLGGEVRRWVDDELRFGGEVGGWMDG